MDNLQIFKEKIINDYMSSIDLLNIDLKQIKQDLKAKLGEEPAISMNYKQTEMIREDTKEKVSVEKLESITIIYTIEREIIPGLMTPFPISKEIIIG